jgi:hypothetical protein
MLSKQLDGIWDEPENKSFGGGQRQMAGYCSGFERPPPTYPFPVSKLIVSSDVRLAVDSWLV